MLLSGLTAPGIWASVTRSLTKMGALTLGGVTNTVLGISATVSLQPALNVACDMQIVIKTNAAATQGAQLIINDGTTDFVVGTVAANATGTFNLTAMQNSLYPKIKNLDAAQTVIYAYSQKQWVV